MGYNNMILIKKPRDMLAQMGWSHIHSKLLIGIDQPHASAYQTAQTHTHTLENILIGLT